MTYKEEQYILDSIDQIKAEVHENSLMLRGLCNAVNVYLANHSRENEEDFGRNVLANIVSQFMDIKSLHK